MGHQVRFHMLDKDRADFFAFLSARHNFVTAKWTSDKPSLVVCEVPAAEKGSLAIWEPRAGSERKREKVTREDGSVVYEFDRQISILEFDPSAVVTHNGLPALLQGRLYSFLSEMDPDTSGLFQAARQWIKRSFEPCPLKLLGGYLGQAAMRWYREENGILLPMFNPPSTPAWEEFIAKQHGP